MQGESAQYTANTGIGEVNVANSGLDGGGTLVTILTAASKGTLVKSVTIKCQEAVGSGNIIRLFIYNTVNTVLLQEILIRPNGGGAGSVFSTYSTTVLVNYALKSGCELRASTENAKKTSVIAEGLDWAYK